MRRRTEGELKARWLRHLRKQGFHARSLSPHQIPGLPDIVAVDKAVDGVIKDYHRGRNHWIEAKRRDLGPRAFDAQRDATAKQVEWILTMHELGVAAWWLILAEDSWVLLPGSQLLLQRAQWEKKAKRYGATAPELREPDGGAPRSSLVELADKKLEKIQLVAAGEN